MMYVNCYGKCILYSIVIVTFWTLYICILYYIDIRSLCVLPRWDRGWAQGYGLPAYGQTDCFFFMLPRSPHNPLNTIRHRVVYCPRSPPSSPHRQRELPCKHTHIYVGITTTKGKIAAAADDNGCTSRTAAAATDPP